jgi:hypothetical protein
MDGELVRDLCQFASWESVVLPKFDRTGGAVQIEYSFTSMPDYVYVGGPVVVGVYNNSQSGEPQYGRQVRL